VGETIRSGINCNNGHYYLFLFSSPLCGVSIFVKYRCPVIDNRGQSHIISQLRTGTGVKTPRIDIFSHFQPAQAVHLSILVGAASDSPDFDTG